MGRRSGEKGTARAGPGGRITSARIRSRSGELPVYNDETHVTGDCSTCRAEQTLRSETPQRRDVKRWSVGLLVRHHWSLTAWVAVHNQNAPPEASANC